MRVKRSGYLLVIMMLVAALALLAGCGDNGNGTTTSAIGTATTGAGTATTGGGTATTGAGGAADGEQIFASTCSGCHGAEGQGASGPNLQTRTGLTKDRVVDQVTNGGGAMPAYSPQLSDEEIDAVADYVIEDIVQQ